MIGALERAKFVYILNRDHVTNGSSLLAKSRFDY